MVEEEDTFVVVLIGLPLNLPTLTNDVASSFLL